VARGHVEARFGPNSTSPAQKSRLHEAQDRIVCASFCHERADALKTPFWDAPTQVQRRLLDP